MAVDHKMFKHVFISSSTDDATLSAQVHAGPAATSERRSRSYSPILKPRGETDA
jgi:hypothetical protein